MPIYLGGGGSQSVEVHRAFATEVGTGRLVYWPFAQIGYNTFDACETWLRTALEPFGVTQIDTWTDLNPARLSELEGASGLYIGGGNTFQLLEMLQRAGAQDALRAAARRALPIYGGSAGAAVLGETVETVVHLDANDPGLTDLRGMDLLDGASTWVHYSAGDDDLIAQFVEKRPAAVLIALPINAGAVLEGGTLSATGSSAILLVDSERRVLLDEGDSTALHAQR